MSYWLYQPVEAAALGESPPVEGSLTASAVIRRASSGSLVADAVLRRTVISGVSDYETEVLADGPSFLLPMDEASGNLTDIVGSKTATVTGSPTYSVAGPVVGHTAIQFTANTQWFTVADHDDIDLGDGSDLTIEFWYARDSDPEDWQGIISKRGSYGVSIFYDPAYNFMSLVRPGYDTLFYGSEVPPVDSSWHHYVLRRRDEAASAGDHGLFVDGTEESLDFERFTIDIDANSNDLHIGVDRDTSDYSALGKIAYVAIYKSWLSDARIAAHYAAKDAVGGGIALNAVIAAPPVADDFAANAVIRRNQTGSLTASAIVARASSGSLTVNSVIRRERSSSFVADAVIRRERSSSFTTNAIIRRASSGSLTADSVIRREQTESFNLDAVLAVPETPVRITQAVLEVLVQSDDPPVRVTQSVLEVLVQFDDPRVRITQAALEVLVPRADGYLTFDAIIRREQTGSFALDAVIAEGAVAVPGDLTADAVLLREQTDAIATDAIVKRTMYQQGAAATPPMFVGAGTQRGGVGVVGLPSGWRPNDILILAIETANQSHDPIDGWEEIEGSAQGVGTAGATDATRLTLFWRRAVEGDASVTVAGVFDHICSQVFAFRGCRVVGNPWDTTSGGTDADADTEVSASGDTTTVDNCLVAVFCARPSDFDTAQFSGWTNADLTGFTKQSDAGTTQGNGGGHSLATGVKTTAGSFGASTATLANAASKAFITVALAPSQAPWVKAIGAGNGQAGGLTLTWPTHEAGDLGLAFVETANQPVAAPSGWAEVPNSPQGTGTAGSTTATCIQVFWRRAVTAAESAVVFADAGDHQIGRIVAFANVIPSGDPWDVTLGEVKTPASTDVAVTGVTTTTPNTLVVVIVATGVDLNNTGSEFSSWANEELDGLTEETVYIVSTPGNGGGFGVASGVKDIPGSTGTTTATLTNSFVNGQMVIALKPDAAPLSTANAVIHREQTDSLFVDAVIGREQTNSLGLDAVISQMEVVPPITADAVILRELNGSFGIDAVIRRTISGETFAHKLIVAGATHLWGLGEEGVTAEDIIGSKDGTYTGASLTQGVDGPPLIAGSKGVVIPAANDNYIAFADGVDMPSGNDDRTIIAWIKTTRSGGATVIGWGTNYPASQFVLLLNYSGDIGIATYYGDIGVAVPDNEHCDGDWHCIVISYTGATYTFRVLFDGIYIDDASFGGARSTSTSAMRIGALYYANGYYFDGTLSNIAILPSAVSDELGAYLSEGDSGIGSTNPRADAIIRREQEGSLTTDAVIQREQIGSFGIDAVIRVELTTVPGSLTADAVIRREQQGSFAVDAVVAATRSGIATADAIIRRTLSSSLVVSAIVKATTTGSLTGNAVVRATASGTFAADAVVRATPSSTLTTDAIVRRTQAGSFSGSAVVSRGTQDVLTADAILLESRSGQLTTDAILRRTVSGSLTVNATVKGTASGSFAANAVIRTASSGSLAVNSIVRRTQSGSLTAEAVVRSTRLDSISSDAVLRREQGDDLAIDAIVRRDATGSLTANAVLFRTQIGSILIDAVVFGEQGGSFTAAAIIMPRYTADAVIRRGQEGSLTASAIIMPRLSINSIIRVEQAGSFGAAAWIAGIGNAAFDASAVIFREQSGSLSAAAVLLRTGAGSFAVEALIRRELPGSLTIDAVVRATATSSVAADAVLFATASTTLTTDAILQRATAGTLSADAVVRATAAHLFAVDAVLLGETAGSLTTDAILQREQLGSFSISSLIYGAGASILSVDAIINRTQAGDFSTNAVLRATSSGTFSASAIISAAAIGSIGTDAVILKTAEALLTASAVVRAPRMVGVTAQAVILSPQTGSLTAGAVITGFPGSSFGVDAIVRVERTGSFSVGSYFVASRTESFAVGAVVAATIENGFVAGAVFSRESVDLLTASAVLRRSRSNALTFDAISLKTASASVSVDASINGSMTFGFGVSAVITIRRPKRIKARLLSSAIGATLSVAAMGSSLQPTTMIGATLTVAAIRARVAARGSDATLDVLFPSFAIDAVIV